MPEADASSNNITNNQFNLIYRQLGNAYKKGMITAEIGAAVKDIARCLYFNQADWLIKELNYLLHPVTDKQKAAIIDIATSIEVAVDFDFDKMTASEASDLYQDLRSKQIEFSNPDKVNTLSDKQKKEVAKWYYEATKTSLSEKLLNMMNANEYELMRKAYGPLTAQEEIALQEEKTAEIKRTEELSNKLSALNKIYHQSERKENSYNGFEYPYDDYFSDNLGW